MTEVYNNSEGKTEFPCSVEYYLQYALNGVTYVSEYDSCRADLDGGNYLDLLKLITSKLCAANIISEKELLDTLGLSGEYRSTYFKTEQ